jgi:hypothetical protein
MDGDIRVDKVVNKLIVEFEKAKLAYHQGKDGPYFLEGKYTLAQFKRFQDIVETSWKPAYFESSGAVALFGDPSYLHGHLSGSLIGSLICQLNLHIVKAPLSGVDEIDAAIRDSSPQYADKYSLLIDHIVSPTVRLAPHPSPSQNIPYPSKNQDIVDGAAGVVYKEHDMFFEIPAEHTETGRPVIALAFEGAVKNESLKVLQWELTRARASGVVVSFGIKINVSETILLKVLVLSSYQLIFNLHSTLNIWDTTLS